MYGLPDACPEIHTFSGHLSGKPYISLQILKYMTLAGIYLEKGIFQQLAVTMYQVVNDPFPLCIYIIVGP